MPCFDNQNLVFVCVQGREADTGSLAATICSGSPTLHCITYHMSVALILQQIPICYAAATRVTLTLCSETMLYHRLSAKRLTCTTVAVLQAVSSEQRASLPMQPQNHVHVHMHIRKLSQQTLNCTKHRGCVSAGEGIHLLMQVC